MSRFNNQPSSIRWPLLRFALSQHKGKPSLHLAGIRGGSNRQEFAKSYACTFLLGLTPTDVDWPLAQFQGKVADQKETFELLQTINLAEGDGPLLREDLLRRSFDMWWPNLEERLAAIPDHTDQELALPKRNTEDVLAEILALLRQQERTSASAGIEYLMPGSLYFAA